jgi:membrane protease YdiL (CAAX protease family)
MDGMVSIALIVAILLGGGLVFGLTDRRNFVPGWLLVALLLVVANDAMLTSLYGWLPQAFPATEWNWQGKALALALSLAIAATPAFGWRRSGLTLKQARGSLAPAGTALALYALFFVAIAVAFPADPATPETLAFQLTMPGIEEETFYRGILLLAFNEALRGRIRWLGLDWGWGALLSSAAFGLAHAFAWTAEGGVSFEPVYFTLTAVPSLLAVWMRERTGSLLIPILAHNLGNSLPHLL